MKALAVGLVFGACLMVNGILQAAPIHTVEHIVRFDAGDIAVANVAGYDLLEIKQDKSRLEGKPGEPWLPVRNVHILIPAGTRAASVKATADEEIALEGIFRICPAQPEVPVSQPGPPAFAQPDPTAYSRRTAMPETVATLVDTAVMRGYHVAIVQVHPLTYIPATGDVSLRTAVRLELELEPYVPPQAARYKKPAPVFERLIRQEVINPGSSQAPLAVETAESIVDPDDVQYLLIGDADHLDEFQPLLDWKTKKGVPAEAVSVDWIYATYPGSDNQERIKRCIRDFVENKGTVWVVLAGDNAIVPDRDCYGKVGSSYVTSTIPTDLYYAGLDDMDWDDDGDGTCAEVSEDTIDLGPDVIVGRLPIRTAAHATAIVGKILQYEKNLAATGFAEKMLLTGDQLWNAGDAEGKSETMWSDWIDPYWDGVRYRFYDTATDFAGGAAYAVSPDHMDEQLAGGYNFLHMATHGSNTVWAMESGGSYGASRAGAAGNPDLYANIGTIACDTNAFDRAEPCLSEAFIRNPNGGAVSYFGGSRYGWGIMTVSSHGTSFQYDRLFYKFLFTGEPTTHPQQLGAVFTKMKEYWIGSCNWYGSMRWCQFSINLMGDPELPLYTRDPLTLTPSHPPAIPAGPQAFVVDTGFPEARVCLSKGAEVYLYGRADETGRFTASIFPIMAGPMDVTVTAPDHYPYEGTVAVVMSSAGIVTVAEDMCSANDLLHVTVVDTDLKGAGVQSVTMATGGGDLETLGLSEVPTSTGVFQGTIATTSDGVSVGDGLLQVAHGETITATYDDLDDGTGSPATVQDFATVDALAPAISNVQVMYVTKKSAVVTFDTDEVSTGRVRCGLTAGGPYTVIAHDNGWGTTHTIYLDGLTSDTVHYFEVDASDAVGNVGTDDKGGVCYSFKTMSSWTVPFFDDFESGNVDKWEINVGGSGNTPLVAADSTLAGGLSPVSGNYVAYLGDATGSGVSYATMDLAIDLGGLDWAELSFWWATAGLETFKYVRLDIWDGEWHANVDNLAYHGTTWERHAIDLSRFNMIDGFVIRFYAYVSTTEDTDAVYVDDVSVTVPDTLLVRQREAFLSSGPAGGPFNPGDKAYTLTNIGPVPIDWNATPAATWFSLHPTSGTALAPGAATTVTLSVNASAAGRPPGVHPGSVVFTNETTGNSQTRGAELAVEAYATLPFAEDFENTPTLKPYWRITGTGVHRTQVTTVYEPHGGLRHLAMDQPVYDINYARNELTLGIDLAGYENVELSFWVKCFGADPQGPPPSPFLNGADFDGVAVSEDGATWYEVRGLRNCTLGSWEHVVVDLDGAVVALGLSYNPTFKVRFNNYGRYPIGSDGFCLDDIAIDAEVVDDMSVTPKDLVIAAGQEGGPFVPASATYIVTNTGVAPLDWSAACAEPWLDLIPDGGSLAPGTSAPIAATFNSTAESLTTGTYSGTIFFTNETTGNQRWRDIQLTVSRLQPPAPPSDPIPSDGARDVALDADLHWTGGTFGLWNGGFESGDFRGWTPLTGSGWGSMPWDVRTSGTGIMGNNHPAEGLFYAENGFEGNAGYFYEIHQEVGIPPAAASARLTWSERIQWNDWGRQPAAGRSYTVSLQPAGGGAPLAGLYTTEIDDATSGDTGYVAHSVDLMSLAPQITGRVVRIDFREDIPTDWPGWAAFDLDGVSLHIGANGNALYDVYFDTVNPPVTLVASGLTSPTFDPGPLVDNTTYYWRVVAQNAAGGAAGPVWTFTANQPEIGYSPTSFTVACDEGPSTITRTLSVWNETANGAMTYSIAATPAWLGSIPAAGSATATPTTHTVAIDPTGLRAGDHSGTITISAADAKNTPVAVPVTLTVNDVAPTAAIVSLFPNPVESGATVTVTLAGTDGGGSGGTLEDGELAWPGKAMTAILPGIYAIAAPAIGGDYVVRYRVKDDEGSWSDASTASLRAVQPLIACSTATMSLTCSEGGGASTATLVVWNGSAPGTLDYAVATTPACLSCLPPLGSSIGGPTTHTLTFDPTDLRPGDYPATITIAATKAANGPVVIPVSLMIDDVPPTATIASAPTGPLQPPTDVLLLNGSAADGAGAVVACEWRSDLDGILCVGEELTSPSLALTVGVHTIAFVVWDDEGSSATVSTTLTVLNATPEAAILSLGPTPVAAGTTVTVSLEGVDRDERGRSLVDGELTWPGGNHTGVLPGSHSFSAPDTAGSYLVQYRALDDEGEWSSVTTATLEVVETTRAGRWRLYR